MRLILFLSVLVVFSSLSCLYAEKGLVNLDKAGVAIQGYDPVGFFTLHKAVKGDPKWQSKYKGAIYYFASSADKSLFDGQPSQYEPQFGGYCAYGVSRGKLAPVEIEAFQIVNGRLLMQYDKEIRDTFNQDTQGNLQLADKMWPQVMSKISGR